MHCFRRKEGVEGGGRGWPLPDYAKYINFKKEYGSGKPFSFNIGYDAIGYLITSLTEIQAETDKFLEEEKETPKEAAAAEDQNSQILV